MLEFEALAPNTSDRWSF